LRSSPGPHAPRRLRRLPVVIGTVRTLVWIGMVGRDALWPVRRVSRHELAKRRNDRVRALREELGRVEEEDRQIKMGTAPREDRVRAREDKRASLEKAWLRLRPAPRTTWPTRGLARTLPRPTAHSRPTWHARPRDCASRARARPRSPRCSSSRPWRTCARRGSSTWPSRGGRARRSCARDCCRLGGHSTCSTPRIRSRRGPARDRSPTRRSLRSGGSTTSEWRRASRPSSAPRRGSRLPSLPCTRDRRRSGGACFAC